MTREPRYRLQTFSLMKQLEFRLQSMEAAVLVIGLGHPQLVLEAGYTLHWSGYVMIVQGDNIVVHQSSLNECKSTTEFAYTITLIVIYIHICMCILLYN